MMTVGNFFVLLIKVFRFMTKSKLLQATATEISSNEENAELTNVLQFLAPWIEKTDGEESLGSWETSMATKMMVKLLELWLTPESREKVEEMLEYYHPLDRAAMAYALVVYMMTGTKMTFKSAVANQHYKIMRQFLLRDMPELMFAGHMKYMIRKYGKKVKS
jgi:hypothetical protein